MSKAKSQNFDNAVRWAAGQFFRDFSSIFFSFFCKKEKLRQLLSCVGVRNFPVWASSTIPTTCVSGQCFDKSAGSRSFHTGYSFRYGRGSLVWNVDPKKHSELQQKPPGNPTPVFSFFCHNCVILKDNLVLESQLQAKCLLPQSVTRVLVSNPLVVESLGHTSQIPFPAVALNSSGGQGVHVGPAPS